tara:strand:- start:14028 stop:14495 length:468 start_codon:yes stop_codon:yes gene_type:complete
MEKEFKKRKTGNNNLIKVKISRWKKSDNYPKLNCKNKEFCILDPGCCTEYITEIETATILEDTNEYTDIYLFDKKQINWGTGPTIAYKFYRIYKNPGILFSHGTWKTNHIDDYLANKENPNNLLHNWSVNQRFGSSGKIEIKNDCDNNDCDNNDN